MAAFTLADAKNLSQNKLTNYVIDEFRKSPLLDSMVFDDTVKPQGGNTIPILVMLYAGFAQIGVSA